MSDKADEGKKLRDLRKFEDKRLQRLKKDTENLKWKPSFMLGKITWNWVLYREKLSVV